MSRLVVRLSVLLPLVVAWYDDLLLMLPCTTLFMCVARYDLFTCVARYDNECGYSHRVVDLLRHMAKVDGN